MPIPQFIGAHVSAAGGVELAPERANSIGANCMQIFSANQRQWIPKPLSDEQLDSWWSACPYQGVERVIVHASYLLNLSATDDDKLEKSRNALCEELERSQRLGVHGVVLHPGSHLGEGEDVGVKAVAESLDIVFERTADLSGPWICGERDEPIRILLENTAGQGTNLGYRFEHLADMRRFVKSEHRPRIGTCIDTCHAFAAGYDITTKSGWDSTWREYDEKVGIETVGAFHLNDSQKELGSRRDRHAGLGEGEMGEAPFRLIVNDPRFTDVPMVMETPSGMEGWAREITSLRGWAGTPAV